MWNTYDLPHKSDEELYEFIRRVGSKKYNLLKLLADIKYEFRGQS